MLYEPRVRVERETQFDEIIISLNGEPFGNRAREQWQCRRHFKALDLVDVMSSGKTDASQQWKRIKRRVGNKLISARLRSRRLVNKQPETRFVFR